MFESPVGLWPTAPEQSVTAQKLFTHTENMCKNFIHLIIVLLDIYMYLFSRHFYPKLLTHEGAFNILPWLIISISSSVLNA